MELEPKHFDTILSKFLASWTLERIETMTIHEYADLANHDSFCYWLEYGTKSLGAIGRIPLSKFEVWRPRNEKDFRDGRFVMEGDYAYNALKGDRLDSAFQTIRSLIVKIVNLSQEGKWEEIDVIRFNAIAKWKIAFLYSGKRLLPVYSRRALQAISEGLGNESNGKEKISALQNSILNHKPVDEDIVDYSYRVYLQYASRKDSNEINYYIIGSKYRDENGNDSVSIMDDLIRNKCVAMGWLDWVDFSEYMGGDSNRVNQFVSDNYNEDSPPLGKIQGYFRLLSRIKPGDIFAIKSQGSFGNLKIIGYAQVVERDGSVYFHDEDLLGHHIHVEFLEAGFVSNTGENYAATIHQLTPEKDGVAFSKIFGWYGEGMVDEKDENIVITVEEDEDGEDDNEEGYNEKDEVGFERSAVASAYVTRVHNRIQNRFIKYLQSNYPHDKCSGEKRYVDAKRINVDEVFLYEIKPFASAYSCIREGIGQLIDYQHQEKSKRQKRIVIVGPNEPDEQGKNFIREIKSILAVPFSYLAFNYQELSAKEF